MRYVLLTWNPGPNNDAEFTPDEWLEKMVIPLQSGQPPEDDRWSVGTGWKSIQVGDQACLFRQGSHGRGIVATGMITNDAFEAPHWNPDREGNAHFINILWTRALDLNQMITVDELRQEVRAFDWNSIYSSGRIVEGDAASDLAALLGHGPAPEPGGPTSGQGHGSTEHNRLVEETAMEVVAKSFEDDGYEVRDVHKQNLGWDLEAQRRDGTFLIEVKGTTGDSPDFFLTANEHEAASSKSEWLAVVVTAIFSDAPDWYEFSGADVVEASKPIQYRVKGL